MRLDSRARLALRAQLDELANSLRAWDERSQIDDVARAELLGRIVGFPHTTERAGLRVAAADGDGDFPLLIYGDAHIYAATAQGAAYAAHPVTGLREESHLAEALVSITWLAEGERQRQEALDRTFAQLAGAPLIEVIEHSDYRVIKAHESRRIAPPSELARALIRPQAADTDNLGIQLQTAAQLGAALRLIEGQAPPAYVLVEGTMSLPMVNREDVSLFYEHLRRLCCVAARQRGVMFLTVSQSHGLPGVEQIEELAREALGDVSGLAEHWYLRLPVPGADSWSFAPGTGRRLPPPGAVSYLVRFHRSTPTLRIDMDAAVWIEQVRGRDEAETRERERRIFADLDYTCHDQRSYGYPYPLRAARERTRLTKGEREALRRQVIEAGLRGGLRRALFRTSGRGQPRGEL